MKSIINKTIISGASAFFIFNTFQVSWLNYLIIFITLWLLITINFTLYKNQSLFLSILVINLSLLFVFCLNTYFKNGSIIASPIDTLCLLIVIIVLATSGYLLFMHYINKKNKNTEESTLLGKREKDLTLLFTYIENFNIVGLNGRWGTGKSYVINAFKEKVKDQYEFIEIDLMTSNLNEMQPTLIRGFEEVMYSNQILPKYTNKMKNNVASSAFFSKMQDLTNIILLNSDSNSEVLYAFQNELEKLDKKIIVIYEDIDRISNTDVIKEIFSISEKISNNNIKIIYQYDEEIMVGLGFTEDYLEKYIPFKMNLTELHFWELLQFELQNVDESILTLEDFNFIRHQYHRFNVLQDFFEINDEYVLKIGYIPIRKIKHLVGEIVLALKLKKDLYSNYKETVISFYILKHLYSEGYKNLNTREGLLESIKFEIDDNGFTILQLIELHMNGNISKEKLADAFSKEINREKYALLKLFDYELINEKIYTHRFKELKEKAKHKNEKIDRIIWNLLYEGKSKFTNYENAVKKFSEDVLTKPVSEQKAAFQAFWSFFYSSDQIVLDNTTIFKLGSSGLLELFKSFKVANLNNEKQIQLIDFYFLCNEIKEFNLDVVRCMNYSPLNSTEEYLTILKHLNSLKVVGNLRKEEEFVQFLNKYLHGLTVFSFIQTHDYFNEISYIINNKKFALIQFGKLYQKLKDVKKRHEQFGISSTEADLNIIIEFMLKIIDILKSDKIIKFESHPTVTTTISSRRINQEEFDRLKGLIESGVENQVAEIDDSYNRGKITLYELDALLQEVPTSN